jgi:hypothetical protein
LELILDGWIIGVFLQLQIQKQGQRYITDYIRVFSLDEPHPPKIRGWGTLRVFVIGVNFGCVDYRRFLASANSKTGAEIHHGLHLGVST